MKIAEIAMLTEAKPRTIYRWMDHHPSVPNPQADSLLGHPFPKPIGKEGREVIWDEAGVHAWWEANRSWLGRHPQEGESTVVSDNGFLTAMSEQVEEYIPDPTTNSLLPVHPLAKIEAVERIAPGKLRVTFRTVADAVEFKLRWGLTR